ncbi:MAG: hypothetical protein HY335_08490 [Deinococcus sp.]|nr:hypothetical protein [Deinococcus sp.]
MNLVFWGLAQSTGELRLFATSAFGDSGQRLEFRRNFYCWPSGTGTEAERVQRITIGYGSRRVLQAEAFLSGFNVWDRFASLTTVNQVRADTTIVSITDNQVVLELSLAFSSSLEPPRFSTEGCIGWTVLAITVP